MTKRTCVLVERPEASAELQFVDLEVGDWFWSNGFVWLKVGIDRAFCVTAPTVAYTGTKILRINKVNVKVDTV